MSLFPKESAQVVAESLGLTISDAVASALVQDTEYRQRELIHEATKFMKHSKRSRLLPQDINLALRVKGLEPLYGYDHGAPSDFKMVASGPNILFYVPDREVDLEEMMASELPPVPLDVTVSAHWLAIEGVQPRILQNPSPGDLQDRERRMVHAANASSASALAGTAAATLKDHGPLVKTILTQELQLYYTKITEAVLSEAEDLRNAGIESIAQDPGIQGLLPYLVEFISDTVTKNIKNLRIMWTMMRLIRSILFNPDLFVEPYLHHIVPNILSCLVAKRLSETPNPSSNDLRLYASQLNSHICHTFGDAYPTLVPRITKTLLRAFLDPSKSLGCRYGALVGLESLGPQVTRMVILPNVKAFGEEMQGIVKKEESVNGDGASTAISRAADEAKLCLSSVERLVKTMMEQELSHRMKKVESRSTALSALHRELGPQLGIFERVILNHLTGAMDVTD